MDGDSAAPEVRYVEACHLLMDETTGGEGASKALSQLSRAVFLSGKDPRFFAVKAHAYMRLGDFKSALVCIRHVQSLVAPAIAADLNRQVAQLLNVQALTCLHVMDFEGAVDALSDAITLEPLHAILYIHRAVALTCCSHFNDAIKDTNVAMELKFSSVELFLLRNRLYAALEQPELAKSQLEEAAKLAPTHPEVVAYKLKELEAADAKYRLATSCMLAQDFGKAVELLDYAIVRVPNEPRYLLLRAAARRSAGELALSLKDIDTAGEVWSNGGVTQVTNEQDLLAPMPEHEDVTHQRNLTLNAMAVRQCGLGQHAQALSLLDRVVASEERLAKVGSVQLDHRLFVNRGDAYRAMGDLMKAKQDYAAALEACPEDAGVRSRLSLVYDNLGVECFNAGSYRRAVALFGDAIKAMPNQAMYYLHRAEAALQVKDLKAAVLDFRQVLVLDPTNRKAQGYISQFFG